MAAIGPCILGVFLLILCSLPVSEAQNNTACIVTGNVTWTGDFYTSLCNISLCETYVLIQINNFAIGVLQGQVNTAESDIISLETLYGALSVSLTSVTNQVNSNTINIADLLSAVSTIDGNIATIDALIAANTASILLIYQQKVLNGSTLWVPCNVSICSLNTAVIALQASAATNGTFPWTPCNATVCGIEAQVVNNSAAIVALQAAIATNGTFPWAPCNATVCGIYNQTVNNTNQIEALSFTLLGVAYLDNDQTFFGTNEFSQPTTFANTNDATSPTDTTASIYTEGGIAVTKSVNTGLGINLPTTGATAGILNFNMAPLTMTLTFDTTACNGSNQVTTLNNVLIGTGFERTLRLYGDDVLSLCNSSGAIGSFLSTFTPLPAVHRPTRNVSVAVFTVITNNTMDVFGEVIITSSGVIIISAGPGLKGFQGAMGAPIGWDTDVMLRWSTQ